jgi:NAD(P)-dependent dehydrogenase (short-subunit alcohol dehydrogenase family)
MVDRNTVRTALITGANRGIGLETARELSRRGFHVILAARDERKGQEASDSIRQQGLQASFVILDVSSSESIQSAARQLSAITERLDVLINNAAIYPDHGRSILSLTRDQFDKTFQTNTFGPLEVVQAFLPFLKKSDTSRIINVSSGYGQLDGLSPFEPSYCLSKLALNGLTIMLADALRKENISVNSICPGWVRTDMGGPTAPRSVDEGADTAVWLADEASHQLTGKFFRDRQEIPW